MIVAFYSYKGGVGRSLALANVACLMAEDREHPQRVLVWDFDVEAPGLHKLFPPKKSHQYGFVDFAYESVISGKLPSITEYIYESEVSGIDVLPAGKMGASYCDKLQQINWLEFFKESPKDPGEFFGGLLKSLEELKNPYDYILVDSRTGLNDQAGICTQVLADLIIVLFRLNAQNLDGIEHLVPAIRLQLEERNRKKVEMLPVASQVGAAASQGLFKKEKKDAEKIFGNNKLEYISFDVDLVSRESLFCLEKEKERMWPLAPIVNDYERICHTIRAKNKMDTKSRSQNLTKLLAEGDDVTAKKELISLLERRPQLRFAWDAISQVYSGMSETELKEIENVINKIRSENPRNVSAIRWEAAMCVKHAQHAKDKNIVKARKLMEDAIEMVIEKEEKGNIYRSISLIESCGGKIENAIRTLSEARKVQPKNNQIALDLAMLYIRRGAKYFKKACKISEKVSDEIREKKFARLVYLRAFLREPKEALKALESCHDANRRLVEAYMHMINGSRRKAIELANSELKNADSSNDVANWAEFLFCNRKFKEAWGLVNERQKGEELKHIVSLISLFKSKKKDWSKDMDEVLVAWRDTPWNFRELLFFRECCIRDKREFGGRLKVIEELIKQSIFEDIRSSGLGFLEGRQRGIKIRIKKRGRRSSR